MYLMLYAINALSDYELCTLIVQIRPHANVTNKKYGAI